jgi:hypothetical protein
MVATKTVKMPDGEFKKFLKQYKKDVRKCKEVFHRDGNCEECDRPEGCEMYQ